MPPSNSRGENAEALVADLFQANGWDIDRSPEYGWERPDLIVRRGPHVYVVELKATAEGRADRVIPLLSQAILQAQTAALDAGKAQPLAVISVEKASHSLSKQVSSFVEQYAPNVAVGLVSKNGLRYFRGAGLEELNSEPEEPRWYGAAPSNQPVNLFSDLNQWMLKVLLASEIPDHLLHAPRKKYQSGAELADAANVSPMSASRFLQQLRKEGYLDDASRYLALVRRQELFRRWRSAAMRPSPELPMMFLIRSPVDQQIKGLLAKSEGEACLGLFAAADVLRLGHVSGVPPYINVPKLPRPDDKKWRALLPASASEIPDLIVRQALSPKSAFRGAVHQDGLIVSDVIQVWLDVANHPSRGKEQADLIYEKALRPIIGNGN
ncbi:MAG: RpiR family transcriptional regulator [Denitromonas halophila]|nr:MAG: RpiR family transcriptional regulator [Denitromonas halophila]TVT68921.1 MAG: RpiR family transcriptional regulator [Denitromonas halophila]